ncbi:MAG: hypothetical protein ACP6IU_14965 [Candidatus Asgardarchaeia archaeon]
MMRLYIDTSTLLSKYIANDPYSEESAEISMLTNVKKIGSYFTVVELFSTISRLTKTKKLQIAVDSNKFSSERLVKLLVAYILKDWEIYIPPYSEDIVTVSLDGIDFLISRDLYSALQYSTFTKLKTLDNIHIAIASNIHKRFFELNYFVTNDSGILNRRSIIKKHAKIEIVNPSELLELL